MASALSRDAITTRPGSSAAAVLAITMIFKEFIGRFGIFAILACAAVPAAAQTTEGLRLADNLAAAARQAREHRTPIMIAFTQASCEYCIAAKRDYLVPMSQSAELRGKLIILEVDIDSESMLRDFGGQPVTHREFSKRYQVKRVPTVIVMDDRGRPVASPIVGLIAEDFYRLYLQQAIDEGLIRMRGTRPPG
jgi:thioredoxin-related protein